MGQEPELEVPDVIKTWHCGFWWAYLSFLIAVTILSFVAAAFSSAIILIIISLLTFCMIKDNCVRMHQCCLLMFGILITFEMIWELIPLFTSLGGRQSAHTTRVQTGSSVVITTRVEKHPFFDPTQSWRYNMQSAMLIASPSVMAMGALLAWYTYQAFPRSIYEVLSQENDDYPGGINEQRYQGYGGTGGYRAEPQRSQMPTSGGHVLGSGTGGRPVGNARQGGGGANLFQGSGQRLGST